MNILQIAYTVNPSIPCYRLKKALEAEGHKVRILTLHAAESLNNDPDIIVIKISFPFRVYKWIYYRIYDFIFDAVYRKREPSIFSIGLLGIPYRKIRKYIIEADVVHVHWALGLIGYSNLRKLSEDCRCVIWTAHDCWPFTGGCHHYKDCTGFESYCGKCPLLKSKRESDITRYIIKKKLKSIGKNITMIGPSKWISGAIEKSKVFKDNRVATIPNALNTELFKVVPGDGIRNRYGIESGSKVILTGATDLSSPYKGHEKLEEVLEGLDKDEYFDNAVIVIFGRSEKISKRYSGLTIKQLGYVSSEQEMAEIYNMADVFLLTSVNENLPSTVMESMACGTAVTAFDIGGVRDMIDHKVDGYIAKPFSIEDYIDGIKWCLDQDSSVRNVLHNKMEDYCSYPKVSEEHIKIYSDCISDYKKGI